MLAIVAVEKIWPWLFADNQTYCLLVLYNHVLVTWAWLDKIITCLVLITVQDTQRERGREGLGGGGQAQDGAFQEGGHGGVQDLQV